MKVFHSHTQSLMRSHSPSTPTPPPTPSSGEGQYNDSYDPFDRQGQCPTPENPFGPLSSNQLYRSNPSPIFCRGAPLWAPIWAATGGQPQKRFIDAVCLSVATWLTSIYAKNRNNLSNSPPNLFSRGLKQYIQRPLSSPHFSAIHGHRSFFATTFQFFLEPYQMSCITFPPTNKVYEVFLNRC